MAGLGGREIVKEGGGRALSGDGVQGGRMSSPKGWVGILEIQQMGHDAPAMLSSGLGLPQESLANPLSHLPLWLHRQHTG